jgi:hypothetical protein
MISKTNPCPLCDAHGYVEEWDSSILDALACSYQQWLDRSGLPQLSMDEHDVSLLTRDEAIILSQFLSLWEKLEAEVKK